MRTREALESPSDTAHLFVYGTLLSRATNQMGEAMRIRLSTEAQLLGSAKVFGRLYNLGAYPGLVLPQSSGEDAPSGATVAGELYHLPTIAATLKWLDVYEGIDPAAPDQGLYVRQQADVVKANEQPTTAWLYRLRQVPASRPLPHGDWLKVHI